MFYILISFGDQKVNLEDNFSHTWRSLITQNYPNWNAVIIGNKAQIETSRTIIDQTKNIVSTNVPILLQLGNDQNVDFNILLNKLPNVSGSPFSKVIFIQAGDYLSTNYLNEAYKLINRYNQFNENISNNVIFGSFMYQDSKNNFYSDSKVLGRSLSKNSFQKAVFQPKLLAGPIQYFWDLNLIQTWKLHFETELKNPNLILAKFNLDYLLLISKLNNFSTPKFIQASKCIYFCKNSYLDTKISSTETWKSILKQKTDILKNISPRILLKYYFFSIFK